MQLARAIAIGSAGLAGLACLPVYAEVQGPGTWQRVEKHSADTDNLAFFATSATADITSGGQLNGVSFFIACTNQLTNVGVLLPGPAKSDTMPVTIALDLQAPLQETWTASERSDMLLGIWDETGAQTFMKRLGGTERLTLQLAPHGTVSTYTYKMDDVAAKVGEIAERCGWTMQ